MRNTEMKRYYANLIRTGLLMESVYEQEGQTKLFELQRAINDSNYKLYCICRR